MPNDYDKMSQANRDTWFKALATVASMVTAQVMGGKFATSPRTFISNLRLYADQMEKLLPGKPLQHRPATPIIPDCPVCNGQREIGTLGQFTCFHCGYVGP